VVAYECRVLERWPPLNGSSVGWSRCDPVWEYRRAAFAEIDLTKEPTHMKGVKS
jgi:hypothetical protein